MKNITGFTISLAFLLIGLGMLFFVLDVMAEIFCDNDGYYGKDTLRHKAMFLIMGMTLFGVVLLLSGLLMLVVSDF